MKKQDDEYIELRNPDDTIINAFEQASYYHDTNWMEDANCATMDSQDFFPPGDVYFPSLEVAKACLGCTVRKQSKLKAFIVYKEAAQIRQRGRKRKAKRKAGL